MKSEPMPNRFVELIKETKQKQKEKKKKRKRDADGAHQTEESIKDSQAVKDLDAKKKKKKLKKEKKSKKDKDVTAHQDRDTTNAAARLRESGKPAEKAQEPVSQSDNGTIAESAIGKDAKSANGASVDTEEVLLKPMLPPTAEKGPHESAIARRRKNETVERTLPSWIINATTFASVLHGSSDLAPLSSLPLHPALLSELEEQGIEGFFPVQSTIIPEILKGNTHAVHPGDICVSAPTGSGKTLTYVLPILHCLQRRVVRRIRAVVVVPNRDLVVQVKSVFDQYSQCFGKFDMYRSDTHSNIRVVALSSQVSFQKEQAQLVSQRKDAIGKKSTLCLADIIVATPGRLVDHINNTFGLTMEHVQFLVVDEADRLLGQSYQEWLPTFLKASHRTDIPNLLWSDRSPFQAYTVRAIENATSRLDNVQGSWLQKLLFSATLSHDPEQLATLNLAHPRLFVAQSKSNSVVHGDDMAPSVMPSTLSEYMVMSGAANKPLVVLHFLITLGFKRTLIFTSSKESTHRLKVLLNAFDGVTCEEFSSALGSNERRSIIERFKSHDLKVVVCSDAMARGMDLDGVENVISYDPPTHIRTYIHRIGRTARAGAKGAAYTLLRRQELRHFKEIRGSIDTSELPMITLKAEQYKPFEADYEQALSALEKEVKRVPSGGTGHYLELQSALKAAMLAKLNSTQESL